MSRNVEVKFRLVNRINGEEYQSDWIKKALLHTFTYKLSDTSGTFLGPYYLNVSARDLEGNYNYSEMYLQIFKLWLPGERLTPCLGIHTDIIKENREKTEFKPFKNEKI